MMARIQILNLPGDGHPFALTAFSPNSYEANQPEAYRRGYEHALRAVRVELDPQPEAT